MKNILLKMIGVAILVVLLMWFVGCNGEQRLTKAEWEQIYKPQTMEQAEAMAKLDSARKEAEAKLESQRRMDVFKMVCVSGIVASIFALVIGGWIKINIITALASAGLLASGVGFGFSIAAINYAKYFAYGGLVLGIAIGGYALFIIIRALTQVVKTVEGVKNDELKTKLKQQQKDSMIQSVTTEKIVENITNGKLTVK